MGGHIDIASGNPGEINELVKANKIRLIGAVTEKRLPGYPDCPTLKEQGSTLLA
jgi:tripartite-type tricarboxylate transporter receptor subunit TctC